MIWGLAGRAGLHGAAAVVVVVVVVDVELEGPLDCIAVPQVIFIDSMSFDIPSFDSFGMF